MFPHGQLRAVTLALLAVADGSVMAFDELPETVTRGEAAVDEGRGHGGRFSEWSLRSQREGDAERGSEIDMRCGEWSRACAPSRRPEHSHRSLQRCAPSRAQLCGEGRRRLVRAAKRRERPSVLPQESAESAGGSSGEVLHASTRPFAAELDAAVIRRHESA